MSDARELNGMRIIRFLKNSRVACLRLMATKSALVTGVVAFDILKDTRELNGMRITHRVDSFPGYIKESVVDWVEPVTGKDTNHR